MTACANARRYGGSPAGRRCPAACPAGSSTARSWPAPRVSRARPRRGTARARRTHACATAYSARKPSTSTEKNLYRRTGDHQNAGTATRTRTHIVRANTYARTNTHTHIHTYSWVHSLYMRADMLVAVGAQPADGRAPLRTTRNVALRGHDVTCGSGGGGRGVGTHGPKTPPPSAPTASVSTPAPSSTTSPQSSWPVVIGGVSRPAQNGGSCEWAAAGGVGRGGGWSCVYRTTHVLRQQSAAPGPPHKRTHWYTCTSVPHREHASTRTSTSPGPGAGRGTVTSSNPGAADSFRTASMAAMAAMDAVSPSDVGRVHLFHHPTRRGAARVARSLLEFSFFSPRDNERDTATLLMHGTLACGAAVKPTHRDDGCTTP